MLTCSVKVWVHNTSKRQFSLQIMASVLYESVYYTQDFAISQK